MIDFAPDVQTTVETARCVRREPFGAGPAGEPGEVVVLTNAGGVQLRFLPFGGTIVSLRVPDRNGDLADVVLGHDSAAAYAADGRYFGALVGRYANRIRDGRFTLDGVTYQLARNDGSNHLHGGGNGFHRAWWEVETFEGATEVGAVLRLASPDGDEGFPGAVDVRVTYTLTDDDALVVDYHATTDRATPLALTQHAYFNLAGHDAGDILAHELTIRASRFTPVDRSLIPTGELRAVAGTPFDFTTPRPVGARLAAADEQLRLAVGYDHNFVLDAPREGGQEAPPPVASLAGAPFAARLHDPASGRVLELFTTEPGLQLYTSNTFDGRPPGKGGASYLAHAGIALEPQRFPDSPNQPHFPSAIVRPGTPYRSRSVYRFSVVGARA
ncbi:MAG TPA: aldose epimerase family protein [Gemmatimonadaceae bacterium]|nr:aldose epimerase family protein [Gemmatimonadaceae bacterium]